MAAMIAHTPSHGYESGILEDIRVVVGDTDMVGYSGVSAGEKVTSVASQAINNASHPLSEFSLRIHADGRFML
jgi:hypothetical protein